VETSLGVHAQIANSHGVATRHLNKEKLFAVSYQNAVGGKASKKPQDGFSANLKWSYQRQRVKDYNWKFEMDELSKLTGKTSGELNFLLPGKKLGLIELELDVAFPDSTIKKIMGDLEKSNGALNSALWDKVVKKIAFNHCSKAHTKFFARICAFFYSKERAKFSKINLEKELNKMLSTWSSKDNDSFVKSFTNLGTFLIQDPYSFQTFVALAGEDNVCMKFKASGDEIKPVKIKYGKTKGCK
jgi:hypothetical protein